jgi:hypothetical protein
MPKSVKKTVVKKRSSVVPKKRTVHSKRTAVSSPVTYTRYIIVSFSVLLLVLVATVSIHTTDKPFVLGTSIYLARGGNDSGNTMQNDHAGPPPQGNNENSGSSVQNDPDSNTLVDCVGPDSKHFSTSLKACANLNQGWGHGKFNFTEIQPNQTSEKVSNDTSDEQPAEAGLGMRHSRPQIKTHQSGDDSSELDDENNELKDQGIEIKSGSNSAKEIHRHGVKARTNFPLSVDPVTHQLTVTTPAGVKVVTVLPDQAVQNMLQKRILSSVEQQADDSASESATNTTLTEVNNQPVFQIKGLANKKALGILPISFAKTVYVSVENGQVVKTDEDLFSKLIESISF